MTRPLRFSIPIWKVVVTLLFVAIFAAVLLPGLKQGHALWPSLRQCRWEWIAAAGGCQIGVYVTVASIFGISIRALGHRLPALAVLWIAMAFLFTTKAFAVAGLATLILLLGRRGVGADVGQAAAGTFYLADYAGFILLGIGVYFGSGTVGLSPSGAITSFAILLGGVGLLIGILRARATVTRFVEYVTRGIARLSRRPAPSEAVASARTVVDSFYLRWEELSKRRIVLMSTALLACAMHVCESASAACCARAFGAPVSLGVAAAGYVAGNLAALVSFLPGGAGFFEGSMAATLTRLGGVPVGPALAATLAYRVLTLWLPLPFVLGIARELRSMRSKADSEPAPNAT